MVSSRGTEAITVVRAEALGTENAWRRAFSPEVRCLGCGRVGHDGGNCRKMVCVTLLHVRDGCPTSIGTN